MQEYNAGKDLRLEDDVEQLELDATLEVSPYDEAEPTSGELSRLQLTQDESNEHLLHSPRGNSKAENVQGMLFQVCDDSVNGRDAEP